MCGEGVAARERACSVPPIAPSLAHQRPVARLIRHRSGVSRVLAVALWQSVQALMLACMLALLDLRSEPQRPASCELRETERKVSCEV